MADLSERVSFPQEEEKVLELWKAIDAFKTSLRLSEGRPPYTFYDGPPFATGLPHYGHILAGTIKDIVTRYASQTGHYVSRRWGYWGAVGGGTRGAGAPATWLPHSRTVGGQLPGAHLYRSAPRAPSPDLWCAWHVRVAAGSAGTVTACPSSTRSTRCLVSSRRSR